MHYINHYKRWGTLAMTALLAAGAAMAKPALRAPIEFTQPDGSVITVNLVGDEYTHLYLTEDNIPLAFDSELGYVYANLTTKGELEPTRIMARNVADRGPETRAMAFTSVNVQNAMSSIFDNQDPNFKRGLFDTTFPVKGDIKGLVLLVEFKDIKFDTKSNSLGRYSIYSDAEDAVNVYWHDMLNKPGFDGFTAHGSCADWFMDNSRDREGNPQFRPQFDVYGPVTLSQNCVYYGGNNSAGRDMRPAQMIIEACQMLDDQIDFSQYDNDGDGVIDNVYVFYAGLGEADGGGADTVWPHSSNIRYTQTIMLDGVQLDRYACSNEIDRQYYRPDGIGTFVHEFSHVMGLPDLYATTYSDAYTPGKFSVMDYGPYNNKGLTPPNYSTYERWSLEWMEPDEISGAGNFSLDALPESGHSYYMAIVSKNEYFAIENRQKTGWDAYIPGHGMLIWHVQYSKNVWTQNAVNNDPDHQYVDLIEANQKYQTRYASGHTFPGTNTVYEFDGIENWNGKTNNLKLVNIQEIDDKIYFSVHDKANVGVETIDAEMIPADAPCYNLQGMRISNPRTGDLIISNGKKYVVK